MTRETLADYLESGLSFNAISRNKKVSLFSVRLLAFKYGLSSSHKRFGAEKTSLNPNRPCIHCHLPMGENNTYGHKVNICRRCQNDYNKQKGRANRDYAIAKMGGKCANCGFSHPAALAMHHLDPKTKDPGYKNFRIWSRERVDKEIALCALLCQNCHSIHHNGALYETVPNPCQK